MVDDPPPSLYRMPKPRAYRQTTRTLADALKAARGEEEQEFRVFYRVMGITSLVYIENASLSVAYLTKEQELRRG